MATTGAAGGLAVSAGSISVFDLVITAGHQDLLGNPPFAADFMGDYRFSHVYRVHSLPAGVVVMRVGSSGVDIVSDIRTVMPVITIGARSLVRIVLRILVGRPSTRMFAKHEMS